MPNSHITPPEIKYKVHIDEFMKAVRGEPFAEGNGLYRMKGRAVNEEQLLEGNKPYLDDERFYVILIQCQLNGVIKLENKEVIEYKCGLVFYKSIVPQIYLAKSKIDEWHFYSSCFNNLFSDNSQLGDIFVDNSQLRNIEISNNSQSGEININNRSRLNEVIIGSNSQSGYIRIIRSSQVDCIRVFAVSQADGIRINEDSYLGNLQIFNHSRSGHIDVFGNSCVGNISILGAGCSKQIHIYNNSQSGKIHVSENSAPLAIIVDRNSQTGDFLFQNAQLSYVRVENNCFGLSLHNTQFLVMQITNSLLPKLEWGVGTKGELYTSKQTKILHLQLTHTTLLKDSLFSLSDTMVQYTTLEELQIQGLFFLRQVSAPIQYPFAWLDIENYIGAEPEDAWGKQHWQSKKTLLEAQKKSYEETVFRLTETFRSASPVFRISHSSLGKTEITGSDLSGYRFEYLNSKLLDCFITGTELPKETITVYNPHPKTKLNYKDQYEQKTSIYNQFKKIYENQGDVVEASEYHAYAMRYQQKLLWWKLRHETNGFWKKTKLLFENIGFRLNWFSNNHGESWLIAFIFTITVSLLFFTASIWALTNPWDWWSALDRSIHKLPGFMLPTHAVDYLSKDFKVNGVAVSVNLWHTTWDFLGRLFIGYGFFQFIAAFRRHGKKGG